jgi:hypothetical protein
MQRKAKFVVGLSIMMLALPAWTKPIAYPAKNQDSKQQSFDDGECYVWAKNNTGIDPARAASAPVQAQQVAPPSNENDGTVARNVAGGALGGAAIGAIAGDAGKGAAIGAVIGTGRGLMKRRERQQQQQQEYQYQQQQAQQQAQQQQGQVMDTYYRAWGACMAGRGYTIM